jgi:putative two-component system response regulator
MARLLIVDDEDALRRSMRRTLRRAGHEVAEASSVPGARAVLASATGIELVFCDLGLPGESGLELVRSLQGTDVAVVMLTGVDDPAVANDALAIGAYAYLVKPLEPNEVLINVASALRRRELELARRGYVKELESKVVLRSSALHDALESLRQSEASARLAEQDTVERLVTALALRSEETGAHIQRVGLYSALLARRVDTRPWTEDQIRLAAMLHEVGKSGTPDAILLKPGPLAPDEVEIMQRHCVLGAVLLAGAASPLLSLAAEVAVTHHERWDGSGYPNGLSAEDIPLPGRIVAIADVFDALCSDRVYRKALPLSEAVAIMRADRGRQFDPDLLDRFTASRDELERIRCIHPDTPRSTPRRPDEPCSRPNRPFDDPRSRSSRRYPG